MIGAENTAYLSVLAFENWTIGGMQACLAMLVKRKCLCTGAQSLIKAETFWATRSFQKAQCDLIGVLYSEVHNVSSGPT